MSPISPADQLAAAERQYQAVLAAFDATPTAANAMALQQAAHAMLLAARRVWTEPSPEYQVLARKTVADLNRVQGIAATFATPEAEARERLADIDRQIKALQDKNKDIAEAARRQVEAVNKATASTVAAIHAFADAAVAFINGVADGIQGIAQGQYAMLCPVCFYPDMEEPPREFSICPCCGTEFGVDNYAPRDISPDVIHRELRWQWLERGAPWFDPGTPRPEGWSGFEQIWNSPYWLRSSGTTAAPTLRKTVAPSTFVVDARVLTHA